MLVWMERSKTLVRSERSIQASIKCTRMLNIYMFYKHFVCECHNYAHTATMSMYKMLVSLAKLLNKKAIIS